MSLAKKVYKEKNNSNSADFLALHLMSIYRVSVGGSVHLMVSPQEVFLSSGALSERAPFSAGCDSTDTSAQQGP